MQLICVILIALALVVAVAARNRHDEHALMVDSGEFLILHVGGYPGADIVFWLRWDADYITVRPEVELGRFSRTLSQNALGQASDMVCFGSRCVRMPITITYAPAETGSLDPALQLPLVISGHQGVLGLGPRSPVWNHFRYYKFNQNELVVSSRRPIQDGPNYRQARIIEAAQLNFVPIELDKTNLWAQIRLDVDYTFVPYSALTTAAALKDKRHWNLVVYDAAAPHNVRGEFKVDRTHNRAAVRDGTRASIIRPFGRALVMMSTQRAAQAVELSAATNDTWTAAEVAVVGRTLLMSGFSVFGDALTQQLHIQSHWSHKAGVDNSQFWPFYVPFFILLITWIFAVQDSVKEHHETLVAAYPGRPFGIPAGSLVYIEPLYSNSQAHEQIGDELIGDELATTKKRKSVALEPLLVDTTLTAPQYPVELMRAANRAPSRASYRYTHFMQWLLIITRLCVCIFLTSLLFGLGFLTEFWRHDFSKYDQAALYSAFLMAYLQTLLAGQISTHPDMAAVMGQNALLICIWLLAAMERSSAGSAAIMVLTSGWATQYALAQLAAFLTNVLWPTQAYTRTWLHRLGFCAILTVAACFWVWYFCFFTVLAVTNQWSPEDPLGWIFGCFSLLIIVVCALQTYNNTRSSIATVYKSSLEFLVALFEHKGKHSE